MDEPADLGEVLDAVECLAGVPRTVDTLPGGLTNRNYRVRTRPPGRSAVDAVVRVSSPDTGLLAVDRDAEYRNSVTAARAGVGAPVLDYLPSRGVLVVGFLPGITYTDADVAANLPRIATALRTLHAGGEFVNRFDMFALQRRYLGLVQERGFRLPAGYLDLAAAASRIERAMAGTAEALVPCHNDLLAANFLDDGGPLRIIDYEYSGMNEPCFELGNVISEARLSREHLIELLDAYYGRHRPSRLARALLWGTVARYGWTLWGSIQLGVSSIDFDFWAWAMERYEPAAAALTSPELDTLLEALDDAD